MVSIILILIVIAIVGLVVATSIRIVPQAEAYVVERLGAYMETWEVGFHVKFHLWISSCLRSIERTSGRFSTTACDHKR